MILSRCAYKQRRKSLYHLDVSSPLLAVLDLAAEQLSRLESLSNLNLSTKIECLPTTFRVDAVIARVSKAPTDELFTIIEQACWNFGFVGV